MSHPTTRVLRMPRQGRLQAHSVQSRILFLRRRRVILDVDLSVLYGVSVKRLNEQVKRNRERFPADFLFRLSQSEQQALRSHFATSNIGRGGRRYAPYAFTEHGALMAATVLNSPRAVQMSVYIVRAFVHLREMLSANRQIAAKIAALEQRIDDHEDSLCDVLAAIRELVTPQELPRRRIGFQLPSRR